ncbi:hypothetical protein ES708_30320 [subsurface metagenome]
MRDVPLFVFRVIMPVVQLFLAFRKTYFHDSRYSLFPLRTENSAWRLPREKKVYTVFHVTVPAFVRGPFLCLCAGYAEACGYRSG